MVTRGARDLARRRARCPPLVTTRPRASPRRSRASDCLAALSAACS